MRDVVTRFHPDYQTPAAKQIVLKAASVMNIERLIEHTLAAVGGYDFVDEDGRDFNCVANSDSKTATVSAEKSCLTIGSVENKIGSLRVVVFNAITETVAYFYIPFESVRELQQADYGKNMHKSRIRACYNRKTDTYSRIEQYRVSSFEELAVAGTKNKPNITFNPQPNLKEDTMTDANSAIDLAENMLVSLGADNREIVRLVLSQLILTTNITQAQSSPLAKKDIKPKVPVQELEIGNNKIRRKDTDPYYEVYTKQINKNVPLRLVFSDGTKSNILSPNVLAPFIRKNGILAIPCHKDGKIKMSNTDRYRTLFQ